MGLFGTLKKIGKGVLKVGGKVAKVAAPVVGLTGVGLPLAAGLGAAGSLAEDIGSGRKLSLGGALKYGALGAGGHLARGPLGLKATGLRAITGGDGAAGGERGLVGRIGEFIRKDPRRAAELGLAGAGLVMGAKRAAEAGKVRQAALDELAAERAARAPLRAQFMAGLKALPSEREDLGSIFTSASPFSRVVPRGGDGASLPVPAGPPPEISPPSGPEPEPELTPLASRLARRYGGFTRGRMRLL